MSQTRTITITEAAQIDEAELYGNEMLLVEECVRGDRTAKKVLYEKNYNMLLGICIRYVGNIHDAEDLLHESFIMIFQSIKKFGGRSRLLTWMTRIVINNCLQFLKKQNKQFIELKDDFLDLPEEEIKHTDLADLSCEQILAFMDKLPVGYRTVLCLYSIDGWSHGEIARELGIGESTSRSQLAKARRMFNQVLISQRK